MSTERLRTTAQREIERHEAEALRIRDIVDNLLTSMEWHTRQVDEWNGYLQNLGATATEHLVERHLRLIEGGQE